MRLHRTSNTSNKKEESMTFFVCRTCCGAGVGGVVMICAFEISGSTAFTENIRKDLKCTYSGKPNPNWEVAPKSVYIPRNFPRKEEAENVSSHKKTKERT